ncbi:MAG TPA: methyltransferase domain-containing protein [Moraxellaceae bacterium]
MGRGYQHGFSTPGDAMYEKEGRTRKAETMIRILADHFGSTPLASLNALDVGASTGLIDSHLATHFQSLVGIDIDAAAIAFATTTFATQHNLQFEQGDAMQLRFPDNSFDVVICSQVYEHVPDAARMMTEIFRVLRPGGVCYFAAGNRLNISEHHYHLPFLSVIPRPLGHVYVRLSGRARYYYEKHLSYWGLKSLAGRFEIVDYTRKALDEPLRFGTDYMVPPGSPKQRIATLIARFAYWLVPGYLWLLRKPAGA